MLQKVLWRTFLVTPCQRDSRGVTKETDCCSRGWKFSIGTCHHLEVMRTRPNSPVNMKRACSNYLPNHRTQWAGSQQRLHGQWQHQLQAQGSEAKAELLREFQKNILGFWARQSYSKSFGEILSKPKLPDRLNASLPRRCQRFSCDNHSQSPRSSLSSYGQTKKPKS